MKSYEERVKELTEETGSIERNLDEYRRFEKAEKEEFKKRMRASWKGKKQYPGR